jgi:hypothetical protein
MELRQMYEKKQLFDFMIERINDTSNISGLKAPQAFGKWFIEMLFPGAQGVFYSDGSMDGKVDCFFSTNNGRSVKYNVLNTKFTREYDKLAPVTFYNEITSFWRAFENKGSRAAVLEKMVKRELRPHYLKLFERFDAGAAELIFVTNNRRNEAQFEAVRQAPVRVFHLDDVIQHMVDDIEGAMPRTPDMLLTGIHSVLSPDERDSEVPTSIVFARLVDFINYMNEDPFGLLFARNVRLSLGSTPVNKEIRETFRKSPKEFAFSNNGITLLCDKHRHNPGSKELTIENPRIVNGSQTLHSIRDVPSPSSSARVMVRIIEILPPSGSELPEKIKKRKEIISKIAIRSNRQNPIKKWNLVSNDEFQHDMARYFRKEKLFYERRVKEWSYRSRSLKSIGISKGPEIRKITQLISSFYYRDGRLGPAIAKQRLGDLFDEKAYSVIRSTSLDTVYQIFLLNEIISESYNRLCRKYNYIRSMRGHISLLLFSIAVKSIQFYGLQWGQARLTQLLKERDSYSYHQSWDKFTKSCVDIIYEFYKRDLKLFKKKEGYGLSFNNYFKTQSYVGKILNSNIPSKMKVQIGYILK